VAPGGGMGPEMLTALAALGVAAVTAVGAVASAVVGRRQPRGQARRDDFAAVTARQDKEIERLDGRITQQDAKISGLYSALTFLSAAYRSLLAFIRAAGLQPPPPPPAPDEARPYLHDIGT
jgi:hypothetical protein